MIGMFFQILYNIVDTAFVGRLGADAVAAVTFAWPIFFLLMALSSGVAVGMNSALHGYIMSMAMAVITFVAGMLGVGPLFSLFGASASVLPMALAYTKIILLGVFFMFPIFLTNNFFVAQGDSRTPVKLQIITLSMNIVLDPIFIFVFGWGVAGAAIATSLTFFLGVGLAAYYIKKKSQLRLRPKSWLWW